MAQLGPDEETGGGSNGEEHNDDGSSVNTDDLNDEELDAEIVELKKKLDVIY